MKINDAVAGAVLFMLGLAVLVHVQAFPRIPGQQVGPALFPGAIACGLMLCALLLMASGLRQHPRQPWVAGLPWWSSRRHVVAFFAVIGVTLGYVLLATTLGFFIVGPLALVILFLILGVRPVPALVIALVAAAAIWFVFYKLLRVPLPWGVFTKLAF